ncbi:hypothetical protein ACIPLC_35340 [Kitasatospora sp. NPDC086801]
MPTTFDTSLGSAELFDLLRRHGVPFDDRPDRPALPARPAV